ncbi:glycosyl transferase [Effusibacillus lacus]|uniref:Glycosyl transferase n=1 Tax=Effusibacillus lacus TaxID=1348429 RepID=A0A292YRX4_9BACL|nr:glycosyl transferase [Effusibacillus lacus]TCS75932.1 hypothetical protein EDD64_105114 [Effusibacillus lacus]GAX91679.1 glycosyl transferase [Effusibacillus lacus]
MYPSQVSLRHLERLTDDTGLLEHCFGKIPRRQEGYATDDNARALWACVEWLSLIESANELQTDAVKLLGLIDRYLSFLLWVQQEDGSFHNNIRYDRTPEPETASDDCLGRCLWACALTCVKLKEPDRLIVAQEMFLKGIQAARSMKFPRGWAFVLAACSILLMHSQHRSSRTDDPFWQYVNLVLPNYVSLFEMKLARLYQQQAGDGWHWFESAMTYGNGVMPWSLLVAYQVTNRQDTLFIAKESLDFLIEKMTCQQGMIRPIGNRGWCTRHHRSDWDQQPLDVMKLALASAQAYLVLKDSRYKEITDKCRAWFYGDNDLHLQLVDREDGSCCDGLNENGVNLNQGAESTLSYLLTESICKKIGLEEYCYVSCNEVG